MIPDTQVQSHLSESYLRSICSIANYSWYKPEYDIGIDYHIKKVLELNGKPFDSTIGVDVQLKSTYDFEIEDNKIVYRLDNKNYNKLIIENIGNKRILVLLIMPRERTNWIDQSPQCLQIKKCAYWCCLEGETPADNENSRTTIKIPMENIFSKEKLDDIFRIIESGGDLNG